MTYPRQDNWLLLLIGAAIAIGVIVGLVYGIDDAMHTTRMDGQVSITKLERGEDCTATFDAGGNYDGDICIDTYYMYLDSDIPKRSINRREFDLLREGDRINVHYRLGKHGGIHKFKFERA